MNHKITAILSIIAVAVIVLMTAASIQIRKKSLSSGSQTAVERQNNNNNNNNTTTLPTETPVPAVTQITLDITAPENNSTVTKSSVVVTGKTAPKAEVFVNDVETVANNAGNFSVTLTLDEGENPIVVVANDADGNMAEKELMVTYTSI